MDEMSQASMVYLAYIYIYIKNEKFNPYKMLSVHELARRGVYDFFFFNWQTRLARFDFK